MIKRKCNYLWAGLDEVGVSLPMTDTSYSIRSVASWPHCLRMLMASAWEAPCRRIPSILSSLSPGLMVPSLRERKQNAIKTEMGFLNCRRNVLYTREAPRDTIALVLFVLRLFACNNNPLKCRKVYRLYNSSHSICYHGRQVTSVYNTPETFPTPQ